MVNRILVVDDHPVVRMAVRVLLTQHEYEVVAEADNGVDALQLARELEPDIVILDLGIPRMDGMALIPRLLGVRSTPRILVLTSNTLLASRCMKLGVSGFLSKEEDLTGIIRALDSIRSGYRHFPLDAFSTVTAEGENANADQVALQTLTDREVMVLKQLAVGLSNKQIADTMLLSNKTISTYKARIMDKLQAQTVLDLVDFAKRNQLV